MEESFEERIQRISRELNNDKKHQRSVSWMVYVSLGVAFVSFIYSVFSLFYNQENTYFDKKEIQESLRKVINNGASIDEVKRVYNTKNVEGKPIIFNKSDYMKTHYTSNTSLSAILSDLLVHHYNQDSIASDSTYVIRLRNLISTYETIHPFDGLEENQRYYLENIRLKMDSNYYYIQDDLVKLGDELDRKNQLVNKYLDKSELSFKISIIALVFTFIFSIWQLVQNHKTDKKIDLIFFKENELKEEKKPET